LLFHRARRTSPAFLPLKLKHKPIGSSSSVASRVEGGNTEKCTTCGTEHVCVPKPRKTKPWKQILYEKQEFPDNYVDETFLSSLITNANVRRQPYWLIVRDTAVFTQRVALLAIYATLFFELFSGELSVAVLLTVDVVMIVLAVSLLFLRERASSLDQFLDHLSASAKRVALFAGALFTLSPVLKTLTHSYSSDTIWALTFFLMAIHIAFHDYSYINFGTNFEGTVSLNAAIFASVLLASRLETTWEVFAFIFFSFESFAGFPIVAHHCRQYSMDLHIGLTMLLCGLAVHFLTSISKLLTLVFLLSILFITLVCPFWLLWIQKYKNEISGPWDYDDEAEIRSDNM